MSKGRQARPLRVAYLFDFTTSAVNDLSVGREEGWFHCRHASGPRDLLELAVMNVAAEADERDANEVPWQKGWIEGRVDDWEGMFDKIIRQPFTPAVDIHRREMGPLWNGFRLEVQKRP